MKSQVLFRYVQHVLNYLCRVENIIIKEKMNKLIFLYDEDDASVIKGKNWFLIAFTVFTVNIFKNIVEFFKSILKDRPSNFLRISILSFIKQAELFASFNNGTVVVVVNEFVYKFYFKDIDRFKVLYGSFKDPLDLETIEGEDYFAIKMRRYEHCRSFQLIGFEKKLLIETKKHMMMLKKQFIDDVVFFDLFSPSRKIEQLFLFYDQKNNAYMKMYVSLVDTLVCFTDGSAKELCHGDLWNSNIMQNKNGQISLIDYDKSIFFLWSYDFVYFFIMNNEVTFVNDLLLDDSFIEGLQGRILTHAKYLGLPEKSNSEISLCIRLMAVLKLTEYDLRNKKIGNSLIFLNKMIAEY